MEHKTTKNTVSIGTQIHETKIMEAKTYLKKEFNNKYDIDPHFNFLIMAMPDYRVKDMEMLFDKYFKSKLPLKIKLGNLQYEVKHKFFSIPMLGSEVMDFHKELISILNPIRDDYIREKDLQRINENRTDEEETQNILNYGYLRVLHKFIPHITIGNIQNNSDIDIQPVKNTLDNILGNLYQSDITISKIYVSFIEDAEIQSDYKWLWEKDYILK